MNRQNRRELRRAREMIVDSRDLVSAVIEVERSAEASSWLNDAMTFLDQAEEAIEEAIK